MTTPELIEYFENKELPKELDTPEGHINDVNKYVTSHLSTIKSYGQSRVSEAYCSNLVTLKEILEKGA